MPIHHKTVQKGGKLRHPHPFKLLLYVIFQNADTRMFFILPPPPEAVVRTLLLSKKFHFVPQCNHSPALKMTLVNILVKS